MTDREWRRERRIDIAMLAVGLVGMLLVGSLIYYLWNMGWFYRLSADGVLSILDERTVAALIGSLLLVPFIALTGSGFLLVRLDLRHARERREQSEKPPKELSLYEWVKEQQAADKDP